MQRVCAINIQNKREFICDIFFVYVVREVFLLCMYVYIFDLIFEKKLYVLVSSALPTTCRDMTCTVLKVT